MARQPSHPESEDFSKLTDALISSNIYMNTWNQSDVGGHLDTQSIPLGFNTFAPPFSSFLPLPNVTGTPMLLPDTSLSNNPAFIANSHQQSIGLANNQDRGNDTTTHLRGPYPNPIATLSKLVTSDSTIRSVPTQDPLAALKMRAKESVAKRARSIRSASRESQNTGMDDSVGQGADIDTDTTMAQADELHTQTGQPGAEHQPSSSQRNNLLVAVLNPLAKATSAELEDLLAEGRAAASVAETTRQSTFSAPKPPPQSTTGGRAGQRELSEAGEMRNERSSRDHGPLQRQPSPAPTEHSSAEKIEEIDTWLAMTGYYDKPYRHKVLSRRKRLKEIEEEKARLLEEEQEDQRLRGQSQHITPFCEHQRAVSSAATILSPPLPNKEDLGLRIKDSAVASHASVKPKEIGKAEDLPVKRHIEEDAIDADDLHRSKTPRIEAHHRTPPRSRRASLEHQPKCSPSPRTSKKISHTVPRRQSPHSKDGYDRWPLEKDSSHRGPLERSRNEYERRSEYRGRYEQHHDSDLGISQATKPDLVPGKVRFFLLKSWNYENIAIAQREGTWATQTKNEDLFVDAFNTSRHVIFFFSANHSKAFQGYARMQGLPGEKGVTQPSWVKNLHWPTTAPFRLKWIVKDETPYRAVGNLKNPLNENLAIFVGRDGQEIPESLGLQLCDIIDEDTGYSTDMRR